MIIFTTINPEQLQQFIQDIVSFALEGHKVTDLFTDATCNFSNR